MLTTYSSMKKLSTLGFIVIFILLISGTANAEICPDDMTHYWKLDETGNPTSFYDSATATINSTCTSCPTPVTGIINVGQQFDGINDEVNLADDGTFDWGSGDSFSIELWINTTGSTAGNKVLVGRDDSSTNLHWWVGLADNGKVRFQLRDINGNGINANKDDDLGNVLNDGVWHHIVAVRDDSFDENRIFVDGELINSASFNYTTGFGSDLDLNIGYLKLGGYYRYNGILDELAFYNRALELNEIQSHYNDGSGIDFCPNCPDGYALVGRLAGVLRADTNPWSWTHPFNLQCDSDLVVAGFAKEGHPESCPPEGTEGPPCNQRQNYESFEVDMDGNIVGEYTDLKGEGGVENAWFEAGPWSTTATAGNHELTFTHTEYLNPDLESPESVAYNVSLCAKCTEGEIEHFCNDGVVNQPNEECDGEDDDACPGYCQLDCTCTERGGEGCTPDYWKNHTDSWPAPYSPGDGFFSIFGRTIEIEPVAYGVLKNFNGVKQAASKSPADSTLLEALQANGECVNALAVQAVAALLNTASDINFKYSVSQIILMVQSAIPDGEPVDCETVEETRDMLMSQNELWCTLETPPLPPPPPAVFEVILRPATATLKPGETIEYTAFTTRNGYEVRSAFIWEIIPVSAIGSSIDKDTQVYTAGDTCSEITEIIKITDIRHFTYIATASITVQPPLCKVEVSPLSSTANSGETVKFTAVTTCDGNEVEDSNYQWDIASTIGSSLNGADYTAGDNNTDADVTDIITVTDTAHCNVTGSANVTVTFIELPPPPPDNYDITVDPDNKIVASNGEIIFSAVTVTSTTSPLTVTQPSPPNYGWSVESVIGSQIDAVTGIYTSGENTVGHQVIDIISVVDYANNNASKSIEVLVTYGKITSIADFKYWPLPFNTPPTILVSRWIPGYFIGVLVGQNLNTNESTVLRFEPNDDILPFGSWQVVFGDLIIFGIWFNPNPVTSEINITVDTEGELAVANNIPLTVGLLPWGLDSHR